MVVLNLTCKILIIEQTLGVAEREKSGKESDKVGSAHGEGE